MVAVVLDRVTRRYPEGTAVSDLSFSIADGESVVLLGPSGSGKTTVLRLLAGLDQPSSGYVLFDGLPVADLGTADRNVAMVFQQEVLYPTKDVRGNIAFPLISRRIPAGEVAARVEAEARVVGIDRLLGRLPATLSAGHRQLVQLARAMVRVPDLFLIDEPLGGLDPAAKRQLRGELRLLQQGYGVTAVYATHDQEDALALGDRVAVMEAGSLRQLGTGREVYERPVDTFVARFVGTPEMAMLQGIPKRGGVAIGDRVLPGPSVFPDDVIVGVRPEAWLLAADGIVGSVTRIEDQGSQTYAEVQTSAGPAVVRLQGGGIRVGEELALAPSRYHLFDAGSRQAIYHSA